MRYEQQIRDHFTVTSVSGSEFLCMCRWHNDTSQGHLYVNGHSGLYICFSCGAKGSLKELSLPRIVLGSDDVRERIAKMRAGRKEQKVYPDGWLRQFDNDHPYWTVDRGLPEKVVKMFRLGYDPFTDRVTIPLRDLHGHVLGVTYRRLDDGKPKYLEPKGYPKGKHLYGAWLLTDQQQVALTEGPVDTISCWAARVPALGLTGARITSDQVKVLQSCHIRTVVLMLDNDNAGINGTVSIHESLKGSGIRVKVAWYRPYWTGVKDPGDLTPQRLRKAYHSALSITEWAKKVV